MSFNEQEFIRKIQESPNPSTGGKGCGWKIVVILLLALLLSWIWLGKGFHP